MVKKIVNIIIVFGLIVSGPAAQALSLELGLGNVVQDSRRTQKFVKKVKKVHQGSIKRYCQTSNDVTVCAQLLDDEECGLLLSKSISQARMKALVLTIQNDSQDAIVLNGNALSLSLLDEHIVMALMKDAPLTVSSFLWTSFGLYLMPLLLVILATPLFLALPLLFLGLSMIPGLAVASVGTGLFWTGVILSILLTPLWPFMMVLSYNYFKYYYFSRDLHERILNPRDRWTIYPGQRLDRVLCVHEDANVDSFTLKLHGMTEDVAPFFVRV